MVKSGAAFNCTNRFEKSTEVKFHRFPLPKKDLCKHWAWPTLELAMHWVIATRRLTFTPNESSYICGNHFKKDDYIFSDSNRLKPSAVPSIFEFPAHLNKSETSSTSKRKEPFHRVEVPLSKYHALEPTPCSSQTQNSPTKEELKENLKQKNLKIKSLQQKSRRKKRRLLVH